MILHHLDHSQQQLISIWIWISLQLLTHLWIKILGTLVPWIQNHMKSIVICAIMISLWNLYLLGPLLVCYLKSLVIDVRIYISTDPLNWLCYFLSRRRYVAWCAKINHWVLTFPHRLLHMLHWWSRITLYLISSSTLNLLRWALNCLDIIITSWCYFLMASTGLISPLSQRMWNIVICQSNLIKWKSMKHILYGIMKCFQESYIMVQHGIMNRFVYNIYEEMSIISFVCIWLPMHQNSR